MCLTPCSMKISHWSLMVSPGRKVVTVVPRLLPAAPQGPVSMSSDLALGKLREKWAMAGHVAVMHPKATKTGVTSFMHGSLWADDEIRGWYLAPSLEDNR